MDSCLQIKLFEVIFDLVLLTPLSVDLIKSNVDLKEGPQNYLDDLLGFDCFA